MLFDADGVIISSKMFVEYLEKDFDISRTQTDKFFKEKFTDCLVGKADLKTELEPYLIEWGWNNSVDDFLEYWFKAEHQIDKTLINRIQALRKLGIKCLVATNQEKHRAQYMLDKMGFSSSFDGLFSSARIGYRKPSLDFFDKVFQELQPITKDEVLFWDDTIANVRAASGYGFLAEQYTTFENFDRSLMRYIE
jgi:putative hydrolase of the HAD superfamily